jgi:acyl dehydratase
VTATLKKEPGLKKGAKLPLFQRSVTRRDIEKYAQASGDFNPLHTDDDFARTKAFDSVIAHGMLTLAYVSEMMAGVFGLNWLTGGNMDIRFKHPALAGDTLTIEAAVTRTRIDRSARRIYFDVSCKNQKEQTILIGTARIKLPEEEHLNWKNQSKKRSSK